ncbi:MAG: RNA polymerase sigma factor [Chloroflexi bacterium]|nr:RNA polymerase sigma factor [Chloroflexota bacterium]
MYNAQQAVERAFREESGRILASLIRACGSFDLAEDAMQDAFAIAVERWPREGVPAKAGAWITTTARRKAIDRLRRDQRLAEKQAELEFDATLDSLAGDAEPDAVTELADDRLRLIFTCCHPAVAREAQVALTLRTLGGLTTAEIARAFLVSEPTMAQRLVRVKRKIREAGIPYRVPPAHQWTERLQAVLDVIYLVFNEGYGATTGDALIRRDLCTEAIRLGRVLVEMMPDEPEALGLLSLMLLDDARREARTGIGGELVILEEQDRSLWQADQIAEGAALFERTLRMRRAGPYQIHAAIAALHCQAASADETDWSQIAALYGELLRFQQTPMVELNRAVAVGMAEGVDEGLLLLDDPALASTLDTYHLYHASRADLLRRAARTEESAIEYRAALQLVSNDVERRYLERRLLEVGRQH